MVHHQYSQHPAQPGTKPVKKGVPVLVAVLVTVGSLGFGCAAGAVIAAGSDSGKSGREALVASPQAAPEEDVPEESPTPEVEYTPQPEDFKVAIKIVEKSCFGSAGCNVTYKVVVSYTGPDLTDEQRFTVSYEVKGGTEPKIGSFDTVGTRAYLDGKEFISTAGPNEKLIAKVTSVI